MKQLFFCVLLTVNISLAYGKVYYVAVNGNDTIGTGTINEPLESIYKAQSLANPGDTVYIRGGLYSMRTEQISEYYSIWAYVTKLDKSGIQGAPIKYWAYPGESPVFDYTNIKPADKRIFAFFVTGSWIHIKGIEITGVQVTITTHTQSECIEIQGSNNIFEQISMHDGMAIGIYLLRGSNNLILNCDAYQNYDPVSDGGKGGNVDGFGCHAGKGHKNNVFRGCRAWFNSDDGYDLISSHEPVLIDNCWAFYNGYSVGFVSRGDGNGFKAGGYGSTIVSKLPNPIPSNTIRFCLAVKNKQSGFYSNHHLAGSNWYNNTAYLNNRNYNMLNREAATAAGYLKDVPGYDHKMRNNLGYAAKYLELTDIDKAACDLSNNYFDLTLVIDNNDFISLDQSILTAPREADGSLPESDFMHLSPTSDLINKGITIGFPYNGMAPDLGCYESDDSTQAPPSSDATLMELKSDGSSIVGFHSATLTYSINLPVGTKNVPLVEAIPTDTSAKIIVNYATDLFGETLIIVTAEDDISSITYTIKYNVLLNTDASLFDLKSGGNTIDGFHSNTLFYSINLPSGTMNIPLVEAVPADSNAKISINYALDIPGETTIVVTAEDDSTSISYTLSYTLPSGVSETKPNKIEVYPNPASDVLYINNAENAKIDILSYDGKLVQKFVNWNNVAEIDVSELRNGLYIIRLEKDNISMIRKFVK